MKGSVNLNVDNRNIDVAVSLKKEDNEPDFFENIANVFSNTKVEVITDKNADVTDVD